MLIIDGNTIRLTRGDTAYIEVPINRLVDGEYEPYTMQDGDKLILTIKDKNGLDSESYLVRKEISGNTFHILPEDTKHLPFGKYVYDIELDTASGDVFTVVTISTFVVEKEVS